MRSGPPRSPCPSAPRKLLAEFLDLLELEPRTGQLHRPPDSDLRTAAMADGRLLVIWLVLEDQDRVEVVRVTWSGGEDGGAGFW